jgi:uncharacterized repeat protein (TIGR04076 family)
MADEDDPYEGVMFPVKATVLEGCGPGCRAPHPAGQTWLLRGVPPGICSFAFNAIFPVYWTLRFGGADPAEANPDQMHVTCNVPGCGARFRVERISAEESAELFAAANLITLDDLVRTFPSGLSRKIA